MVAADPETAETHAQEMLAADLCAMVYQSGKVAGHFEMPLDRLHQQSKRTPGVTETALILAERRDWIRRGGSGVTLKAAGIYVAKGALGLPR